ncbi:hypothetical protein N9Y17_04585 [Gammaproteobacteria bacterium]|nr:hypothetical protein [Gammaproteobacteria bacterium]
MKRIRQYLKNRQEKRQQARLQQQEKNRQEVMKEFQEDNAFYNSLPKYESDNNEQAWLNTEKYDHTTGALASRSQSNQNQSSNSHRNGSSLRSNPSEQYTSRHRRPNFQKRSPNSDQIKRYTKGAKKGSNQSFGSKVRQLLANAANSEKSIPQEKITDLLINDYQTPKFGGQESPISSQEKITNLVDYDLPRFGGEESPISSNTFRPQVNQGILSGNTAGDDFIEGTFADRVEQQLSSTNEQKIILTDLDSDNPEKNFHLKEGHDKTLEDSTMSFGQ